MYCPLCSKEMSVTPRKHFDYISNKYNVGIISIECTNCKITFTNSDPYCSNDYDIILKGLENKFYKYKEAIIEKWKKDEAFKKICK